MTDKANDRLMFAGSLAAEGRRLRGSVEIAGHQDARRGELVEIDLDALFRADRSGAVMTIGHQAFSESGYDPLRTVARLDNGSLRITPTRTGFDYETDDLPNTTYANDTLELARAKVLNGVSFDIFGLRSSVRMDAAGNRVRRYTSIAQFGAISPVIDPAFPSTMAAFSKESNVPDPIEDPKPEPKADPPKATIIEQPKSGKDDWAAFAKDLSTEQIEATLEQVFSASKGHPEGELADRYEGFAQELRDRKRTGAIERARGERLQLEHDLILGRVPKAPEAGLYESDDYKAAFSKYLRGDTRVMEQFAQTVAGDGTQGGFMVPDGFVAKLGERLKAYGGIAGIADEVTTTTGESLRWPYIDDTSNKAAIVAEDTQASTGADLVLDSIELGAFEYDATGASGNPIEISLTLLQDSAIDIEGRLTGLLGTRIGRKQADDFATGMGGTEPFGLLSKTLDTMTATVVSLAGPEHIFQVDRAYRDGARWVMSDTTLAKLWTAQATTNEPLFQPGRTLDGKPFDVFFGYPITIDNSAGNLVAFGDITAGYIVRRVRGIQLLVDPYTAQKKRAIQYHAWARADANVQDANAFSVSTWASVTADT